MSQRFQFSLRSLFWLTAVVAVVVGTMSTLGRTHHFRALGSYHAYLALLPIAGVWAAYRCRMLTGRRRVVTSLLLYLASFTLPFLRIKGTILLGYEAFWWSLIGTILGIDHHVDVLSRTSGDWLGYCLITLANATYIVAFFLKKPTPAIRDARVAWRFTAMASSLLAFVLPSADSVLDAIYIGYGVWVAAMLATWLGVGEEVTCVSTSAGRKEIVEDARSSAIESPDARDSTAR